MCQIDVCTCTRLFETIPSVQPPSRDRPLPFLRPTISPPPRRALRSSTRSCHHPYYAIPTLTVTYTFYHRPPTSPISPPAAQASPSHPRERGVTASTIHNAHHYHPFLSPIKCSSLSLSLFEHASHVLFLFRLLQTPDPIHPAGTTVRYGAVSTRTPARSLKENAIIRRTSTNELIVGASCYRQYWEVLYSTSPGATRL